MLGKSLERLMGPTNNASPLVTRRGDFQFRNKEAARKSVDGNRKDGIVEGAKQDVCLSTCVIMITNHVTLLVDMSGG